MKTIPSRVWDSKRGDDRLKDVPTRLTINETLNFFLDGEPDLRSSTGSLYAENAVLYSYGSPIAKYKSKLIVVADLRELDGYTIKHGEQLLQLIERRKMKYELYDMHEVENA